MHVAVTAVWWLLLATAAAAASTTQQHCAPGSQTDCSLNGVCAPSGASCICDDGWTGSFCSSLKQGHSTRIWPPAGTAGQNPNHLAASWGAGLVPPVPGVSDLWHLFVDSICIGAFPLQCSHTHMAQLVHATASHPAGALQTAVVNLLRLC